MFIHRKQADTRELGYIEDLIVLKFISIKENCIKSKMTGMT